MTFWYLPRSIDTIFLVVYEPHRALEGVGFQGKNCFTKMVSNLSDLSLLNFAAKHSYLLYFSENRQIVLDKVLRINKYYGTRIV